MSRIKNKSKLKFVTEENNKRRRIGYFFLGFGVFAVLLGAISLFMLLRAYDYDLSNIIAEAKEEETTQTETQIVEEQISGKKNFLLIETSNDSKEIYLIAVVNADMDNKKFNVCSLPADAQLFDNGKAYKLKEDFYKDGAKGVAKSLTDYGIEITRYVSVKEKNLKSIINTLGGIVVDNEQSIDYKSREFDLVLSKGKQTLKGDTAVKYLKYNWDDPGDKLKQQAYFICNLLDQSFTEKNMKKGESLFGSIVNLVDTDITAIDFGKSRSKIDILIKSEDRKESSVTVNIDELKKA